MLSEGGREDQQGTAFPRLCGCSRRFGDTFTGAGCGIPAIRSDEELAIELLIAKSVHLHPGNFYDFPSGGFLAVGLFSPQRYGLCAGDGQRARSSTVRTPHSSVAAAMPPTMRILLGIHNLVDDAQLAYNL